MSKIVNAGAHASGSRLKTSNKAASKYRWMRGPRPPTPRSFRLLRAFQSRTACLPWLWCFAWFDPSRAYYLTSL